MSRAAVGITVALVAVGCVAPQRGPRVLLRWSEQGGTLRQAIRITAPVARREPVAAFSLGGPAGQALCIADAAAPDRPLPVWRDADGRVAVRVPGEVAPGRPRVLVAYWCDDGSARRSALLDGPPAVADDYATATYGDAWDFDEGDQEGIQHWGDRPHHYGRIEVRDGRLIIPVTGPDPYFIWGAMFGDPQSQHVEHIDSALYTTLRMRLRQSCPYAKWSLFVTDAKGVYQAHHFHVRGTGLQELTFDLPSVFVGFWDGREFRALRIDPTNDVPGTTVEIDSVRLERVAVAASVGPLLTREQAAARARVRALRLALPEAVTAGERAAGRVVALGSSGRPVPDAVLAVWLQDDRGETLRRTLATDGSGAALIDVPVGRRAGRREWLVAVADDLGQPAGPTRRMALTVGAGALDHYELSVPRRLVLVSQPRLAATVWGADSYGNRIPVHLPKPQWTATGGATVEAHALEGAPATVAITCSARPLTRHQIALRDEAGRAGTLEVTTMALKKHAIRPSPNGYLVDADGALFLPLGGFYANWPSGLPAGDGSIQRAVDLFPCGPKPYPHGYPWPPEVEKQVSDYLRLCHRHGVTALRLMLRNMDIVGRVDPVQLKAVLHMLDLARPLGIRFNVVLFEDYTKPPYVNRDVLEKIALPHYSEADLAALPRHRARFLVDKRILAAAAQRYHDRDAIACQKDYLVELLPHLAPREEIFCYEFENEMVHPPMSWVNEMAAFIRDIDPRTPVLGNPGPHNWPEPWRWREAKVDLFSYHPYNNGQPDADHGAVAFTRSKWAAACGVPMFTGEGGINQNRWHKGVKKVPTAYAARGIRDQIWLSLCCGANGAFMWTASHEAEMAEFAKVLPALRAVGIDLTRIQRRRPRTVVIMPDDSTANARACAIAWRLLGLGVDFDTLPPDAGRGYRTRIEAATADASRLEAAPELIRPSEGYQLCYLASKDADHVLVYLRNAAGGIVNLGDGRPCHLRQPRPATAALRIVARRRWPRVRAYDLDERREVEVSVGEGGGLLTVGQDTSHDYVIGLRK